MSCVKRIASARLDQAREDVTDLEPLGAGFYFLTYRDGAWVHSGEKPFNQARQERSKAASVRALELMGATTDEALVAAALSYSGDARQCVIDSCRLLGIDLKI